MAIVAEYRGSRGGTVYIDDSELRKLSHEELKANQDHMYAVARGIMERTAIRELQAKQKKQEN